MKRKLGGRDVGLAFRMLVVLALLALIYAGFGYLVWEAGKRHAVYWLLLPGVAIGNYVYGGRLLLRLGRASIVSPEQAPEQHRAIDRLCSLADLRKPDVALVDSDVPNAFSVSRPSGRSVVAVTKGLLRRLDQRETEAVLAHELAHIANRDVYVMTPASFMACLGAFLYRWFVTAVPIWVVPYALGNGLLLALSRYREYAADRVAVLITGSPEHLMSALQKISEAIPRIPRQDLRELAGMNAFFILPTAVKRRRWELRMDHPPLEKRLERLGMIAREMGKAAA